MAYEPNIEISKTESSLSGEKRTGCAVSWTRSVLFAHFKMFYGEGTEEGRENLPEQRNVEEGPWQVQEAVIGRR
jgi:hypothetical protein